MRKLIGWLGVFSLVVMSPVLAANDSSSAKTSVKVSTKTPVKSSTKSAAKKPAVLAETAVSSDSSTTAEPEPTPDPLLLQARIETKKLRDAWDRARLESTVYDKRYRRAYERWVKATKEAKDAATKKRDAAMVEFKISLEKRRLAWYEWELAKAKQVALEAQTKAKALREDVTRVKKRIESLGGTWKPTPTATKTP